MDKETIERLKAKTPEQRFLQSMENDFQLAPRVAAAVLEEVQDNLLSNSKELGPGQIRVVLTRINAPHGRRLRETDLVEVIWSVDAGEEDLALLQGAGRPALRRSRIRRLLEEALDQGAVATQEDLARALQTSVRTIKRDCAYLKEAGKPPRTRGYVRGIGRGQSHKAEIVRRWLQGETYDQIELQVRHNPSSIRRYLKSFVQVVQLERRGIPIEEIAELAQISSYLVEEYLRVYRENDTPSRRQRLNEQMERLNRRFQSSKGQKRGGR